MDRFHGCSAMGSETVGHLEVLLVVNRKGTTVSSVPTGNRIPGEGAPTHKHQSLWGLWRAALKEVAASKDLGKGW